MAYPGAVAVAGRVLESGMRGRRVLAGRGWAVVEVPGLLSYDVGYGGDDLRSGQDLAGDVVRGGAVITSQKNGVSAQGLQRVLGFGSYETAWVWMHTLRRAMVRPECDQFGASDVVAELDETFVVGVSRGRAGAGSGKVPVMIAVEKRGRKLGRIRLGMAQRPGSLDLLDLATDVIAPSSTIRTDECALRFKRRDSRSRSPLFC